ncbi:autotransporter outer membrane beta-barrel domain-containing protein [Pseudomonas sp. NPDC089406]|uniref:autotransporter family protein n=1 Tax=Pseudomonas sp. NPDC089406 TaxID=3364463 RepID=UPI00384ABE62
MVARMLLPLVTLYLSTTPTAHAACSFITSAGDDSYVCDSASAASLTDTSGNNSLTFPAGGSGSITGNLTFGAGRDRIDMASGSIGGSVNQGDGVDAFNMSGGVIEGSLNQGDGLDTFHMTGGWIKGTFDSGDFAEMDGGRIGNVNMRLDKNTFIMRGGSIDQNIITGFDTDLVELFAGTVGGNISVSGGDDRVLIHGGQLGGNVLMSTGNDQFTWNGGHIAGQVQMDSGDDVALLQGLTPELLNIVVDGGAGNDSLALIGSHAVGGTHYTNWEQVTLGGGSRLDLDDTLHLGDNDTGTGTLRIDAGSTLASRQGTVMAFGAGQRATLLNAGTVDLATGNDAQGRLTVAGDYQSANGLLRLNSVLAGDGAPADRLVIDQGSASGSTRVQVANLGGAGAATLQDGIMVVETRNGANTAEGAFSLAAPVSAGAYDYQLFKGGVSAGSAQNWYLRSVLLVFEPGAGPTAAPVASIPLYRPEVPVYAAAPRGAAVIARQALGTFHQRQGDQRALAGSAAWGQAYGGNLRQSWSGTVDPSLDGDVYGFRVGHDLYAKVTENGVRQQAGLYLGHSRLDAQVKGFALAVADNPVGDLELASDSLGAYWTRVGAQGGYVDAVLQYSRLEGRARSDRGGKLDVEGQAWSVSLETGLPLALSPRWSLEPQAQVIAQKVNLDSAHDAVSRIEHDAQVELTARLGLRLVGSFAGAAQRLLQPYAQVNLWHGDGGRDSLVFDDADRINTDYRYTSLQLESGVLWQASEALTLHGGVQYSSNLDSRQQRASGVNLGLRWQF